MQVQRCPECGMRLKTNYCDICMRKVPFKGVPAKQTWQQAEGSSAHREENHECVSFGEPKTKPKRFPSADQKTDSKKIVKKGSAVAIILAVMLVISSVFGMVEDLSGSEAVQPEPVQPEKSFLVAGESGAETVPGIEATELYNDGAIIVTADFAGLYYDAYTVFMTVVNESVSDIIVGTDLLSVNGYMHSSSFYAEVGAGESVQEPLQLYSWELEQAGIDKVEEIAFYLNVYDTKDYADIASSELITIETDIADTYEQPEFLDGWELYRDKDLTVRLVSIGAYYGDCELRMYIENLSDRTVSVSVPNILINGQEAEGYLWNTLRPDTRVISDLSLYDLGINGIEEIEEITLDLQIEYMEDWYIDETVNETITFNPNELPPVF